MKSNEKIILAYKKDENALTSSGELCPPQGVGVTMFFTSLSFRKMIYCVSDVLKEHPHAGVEFRRLDYENLTPYTLDQETVDLIREDPITAANSMEIHPSPSVGVRVKKKKYAMFTAQPLPAGRTTLVEAFGDELFFRLNKNEFECPGCRFWSDYNEVKQGVLVILACKKKCKQWFPVVCDDEWGCIRTDFILSSSLETFYFPRLWNEGGPWVTKQALQTKYEGYLKEKETLSK